MLSAATNAKEVAETGDLSLQVEMVAGHESAIQHIRCQATGSAAPALTLRLAA
jgi:hypothetical protein